MFFISLFLYCLINTICSPTLITSNYILLRSMSRICHRIDKKCPIFFIANDTIVGGGDGGSRRKYQAYDGEGGTRRTHNTPFTITTRHKVSNAELF